MIDFKKGTLNIRINNMFHVKTWYIL